MLDFVWSLFGKKKASPPPATTASSDWVFGWTVLGGILGTPSTEFATCGTVYIGRVSGYVASNPGSSGSLSVQPGVRGQSDTGCQCCHE